jgi:hypothetical protein
MRNQTPSAALLHRLALQRLSKAAFALQAAA